MVTESTANEDGRDKGAKEPPLAKLNPCISNLEGCCLSGKRQTTSCEVTNVGTSGHNPRVSLCRSRSLPLPVIIAYFGNSTDMVPLPCVA